MNTNFTIYRRGRSVFKMESRQQGEIRKMSTATFHQEIMTDDSIKITLVSIKRIDFRLRDYIIYEDRPYFLNRLPQASIDESGRYVYQITFEGGMFELGRKAFVLHNAIGYEYYGSLAEFGRLIVDNMNENNMFIEWDYEDQHGEPRHYKAKFYGTARDPHDITTLYMWGAGFNHDLEGMKERFIYTNGLPVIDDENEVHPVDPEDLSYLVDCVVTAVHQWSLDFPKQQTQPPVYPPIVPPIPQTVYVLNWDTDNPTIGDINALASSLEYDNSHFESPIDYIDFAEVVEHTEVEIPSSLEPPFPTLIGDVLVISVPVSFNVHYYVAEEDNMTGTLNVKVDRYEWITLNVSVTFHAVQEVQSDWQITPVTPPSGQPTAYDYPTEDILLAYDDRNCLAVLQDMMDNWDGWEFDIQVGRNDIGFANGAMRACGVITMRQKGEFDTLHEIHNLGFGRGGGIHQIVRKYADDSNIPSRVYFYGGSQNLPQYYRNTRLCLPKREREDCYIDFAQFTQTSFPLGVANTPCEEVKIIDDIFPACKPFVLDEDCNIFMMEPTQQSSDQRAYLQLQIPKTKLFDVGAKWTAYDFSHATIPITNFTNYPDYGEWLSMRGYDYADTQERRDRYADIYVGKSKYLQGGTSAKFVFQTGDLAGYSLSMHSYSEEIVGGVNCCIITLNVVNEENEEVEGYHVPNNTIICHTGDKFIIEDINMPPQYTYYQDGSDDDFSAENALWRAALEYMGNVAEKVDYKVSVARDFVKRNGTRFDVFDTMQFTDILTENKPTLKKRIVSVELDLIDGYTYKLNITNRTRIAPTRTLRGILGIRKEK